MFLPTVPKAQHHSRSEHHCRSQHHLPEVQPPDVCFAYTAGEIPTLCVALRVRHPLRLRSGQQAIACWLRMTYPRPTVQPPTVCVAYTAGEIPTLCVAASPFNFGHSPPFRMTFPRPTIHPTKSDFIVKRLHPPEVDFIRKADFIAKPRFASLAFRKNPKKAHKQALFSQERLRTPRNQGAFFIHFSQKFCHFMRDFCNHTILTGRVLCAKIALRGDKSPESFEKLLKRNSLRKGLLHTKKYGT